MVSSSLQNQSDRHGSSAHASVSSDAGVGLLDRPDLAADGWLHRFEAIYRDSAGDPGKIPWAHRQPCPALLTWLDAEAPSLIRPGARVAVVGCGLGEDACALADRGYEVVGFDACPSAIQWATKLHPGRGVTFVEANLFDLPTRLQRRFDLVVEVHTLQALPPAFRHDLAAGMASMLNGKGYLLAIARGRAPHVPLNDNDGPPFPLTAHELLDVMAGAGLDPVRAIDDFMDDNVPPVRRLRGAFHRA